MLQQLCGRAVKTFGKRDAVELLSWPGLSLPSSSVSVELMCCKGEAVSLHEGEGIP